jgi:hypothetical protein
MRLGTEVGALLGQDRQNPPGAKCDCHGDFKWGVKIY